MLKFKTKIIQPHHQFKSLKFIDRMQLEIIISITKWTKFHKATKQEVKELGLVAVFLQGFLCNLIRR